MEDDYEATVVWADQEEKIRTTRGQPVSNVYLFALSFFVLGACLFVLYLFNRNKKELSALDMAKDPENVLYQEFPETEVDVIGEDSAPIDGSQG